MQPRVVGEAAREAREPRTRTISNSGISKTYSIYELVHDPPASYLLGGMFLNAPDVGIVPQRSLLDKSLQLQQAAAGRKSNVVIASWKKSLHGRNEDDCNTEREKRKRFDRAYKNFRDPMFPSAKGTGPEILLPCRSRPIRFLRPPSSDGIRPWMSLL
jgi:hypothetical protein